MDEYRETRERPTRDKVESVMGFTLPEENDPFYNFRLSPSGATFSFSGLTKDYTHVEGEQKAEGTYYMGGDITDYQIHRVVALPDGIMHYRLCKAIDGSDYEAYVVGRWYSANLSDSFDYRAELARLIDGVEVLTRPRISV